jgi:protein-tyrosine phosphatase
LDEIRHIAGKKIDPAKAGLLMNELYPGRDLDVPDPYYGKEDGYHSVYKMIDEVCEAIIRKYQPSHDLASRGQATKSSKQSNG